MSASAARGQGGTCPQAPLLTSAAHRFAVPAEPLRKRFQARIIYAEPPNIRSEASPLSRVRRDAELRSSRSRQRAISSITYECMVFHLVIRQLGTGPA